MALSTRCGAICISVLLLSGMAPVYAASSSGLDTPAGVTSLPIAVGGATGLELNANADPALPPTVQFSGPIVEGGTTINTDGSTVIGNTASAAGTPPSANAVLTVNGGVTIVGTATPGADCSNIKVGTIAQDGTGRLLSCQLVQGSKVQTAYSWQTQGVPTVLSSGTISSGYYQQANKTFTLSEPGMLNATGWAWVNDLQDCSFRYSIKIDGTTCAVNGDISNNANSCSASNYEQSASCVMLLKPGTHTITSDTLYQNSSVSYTNSAATLTYVVTPMNF